MSKREEELHGVGIQFRSGRIVERARSTYMHGRKRGVYVLIGYRCTGVGMMCLSGQEMIEAGRGESKNLLHTVVPVGIDCEQDWQINFISFK